MVKVQTIRAVESQGREALDQSKDYASQGSFSMGRSSGVE